MVEVAQEGEKSAATSLLPVIPVFPGFALSLLRRPSSMAARMLTALASPILETCQVIAVLPAQVIQVIPDGMENPAGEFYCCLLRIPRPDQDGDQLGITERPGTVGQHFSRGRSSTAHSLRFNLRYGSMIFCSDQIKFTTYAGIMQKKPLLDMEAFSSLYEIVALQPVDLQSQLRF